VSEGYEIREFRPGDESAILALFQQVFGRERSLAHWRWKFEQSPYPGPQIALAFDKRSGALAAHYAVVPVQLNWMGRPLLAAQSVDTMVHPDAQGRGLFEATARALYAALPERGIRLVYGLPNRSSYPGFMRKLAWKRVGFLSVYQQRLSIRQPLARVLGLRALAAGADLAYRSARRVRGAAACWLLRRRLGGRLRFRASDALPEAWDGLWDELRSHEVVSLWKDAEYLRWRYDRHPERRFAHACLERDGALVALAVVELGHRRELRICELQVQQHDVLLARLLLAEIAAHFGHAGAEVLSFRGLDAGFSEAVFQGFERETDFALVFAGRPLDAPELAECFARRDDWSLTLGDTDLV